MAESLTRKQQAVMDCIERCIEEKGYGPTVREICAELGLSSPSTVHVHLKTLEQKGYIVRGRSKEDERNLEVSITEEGERLKEAALRIRDEMGACMNLRPEEVQTLYDLLYKLLKNVRKAV